MSAIDRQAIERYVLECSVCMETFNDKERQPRILPCQHSFCLACLKKMLNSGKVTCSQCRAENEVPDIDKLPKDNTRRDLMEILQKPGPASPQACTMCNEGAVAVAFCEVCKEYMCDECTKAHKRVKITSKHAIADIDPDTKGKEIKLKTYSAANSSRNDNTGKSFCLTCDKVVQTCTEGHEIASLDEGYVIRQRELKEMVRDLDGKISVDEFQNANEAVEREKNKYTLLRDNLSHQFKAYTESLKKREEQLLFQLNNNYQQNEKSLKQRVEDMTKYQAEVRNAISLAEQLCYNADREGFLATFVSAREELKRLCSREIASPDTSELFLTRACTTEDFDRIVETVGSFITKPEIPANYVTHAESSSSLSLPDGKSQPVEHSLASIEPGQSEQLMEVLKSITLSGQPYVVSTALPTETSWNNQDFCMSNRADNTVIDLTQYKANLEDTIAKGLAALLRSPDSRTVIQSRFVTNRLRGDWQVDKDNKLTVYANSAEEGQYCRQIIDDSVCTMKVTVRAEAIGLVHSDKWLALTRSQHQKYKDKIAIDVCHDQNKIALYSFSNAIARDVKDAVNIFFRENDVRTIYLKFNKNIVSLLLKQKKLLKKYLASWSHYFVQVIKHDDVTVAVKGIGIGLAQVTRCVHELARKCASALENNDDARFDDDDDDDDSDDDTRFDDIPKGNVNVEFRMETAKANLKSLSLLGDDRVVYVLHGDVTELPVEVIVNPADKKLNHNGGLAKILVRKGGKCIQEECRDFINQHGELKVGDTISSGAGDLNCHVIVHAVGPKWTDGKQNEEAQLERAVYNSLHEANRKMLLSIAIPAIGAGTFGFPLPLAARCIARALKKFFLEKPVSSIREVYLVDISMETVVNFTSAIKETYPDGDHIVSSTGPETPQQPLTSSGKLRTPMIF